MAYLPSKIERNGGRVLDRIESSAPFLSEARIANTVQSFDACVEFRRLAIKDLRF